MNMHETEDEDSTQTERKDSWAPSGSCRASVGSSRGNEREGARDSVRAEAANRWDVHKILTAWFHCALNCDFWNNKIIKRILCIVVFIRWWIKKKKCIRKIQTWCVNAFTCQIFHICEAGWALQWALLQQTSIFEVSSLFYSVFFFKYVLSVFC